MTFLSRKSNIRTVKQGDPLFTITDGITLVSRAGFEVNKNCPTEYKQMLMTAIDLGWIKPVAYMTAEEQLIETLKL